MSRLTWSSRAADVEQQVLDIFRESGWSVEPDGGGDFVARRPRHTYLIQIKAAAEGRADRLVPLLAQAILEVRAAVSRSRRKASPLAIVAARRLAPRTLDQLSGFARLHAPDVAFGAIDSRGLRYFSGPGLESLNARVEDASSRELSIDPKVDLFSDLNQWLLKVLLAPCLQDPKRLNAPLGDYRNATQLAAAAGVSVMTAFRFLRALAAEGFLDEHSEPIRLVRLDELLRRWQVAAVRPVAEINARWIFPGEKLLRLKRTRAQGDRVCVALFAAAEALGLGFVHGAVTHIYVPDLGAADLRKLGVIQAQQGQNFDVVLRAPSTRESVFRGAVEINGLCSCDVFQVWLDVAPHPSRGTEQAELIYRKVLKPMIERARNAAR
ncbi:MAG TPA: hypothetical protein VFP80_17845 [Thermoanaerobaculia bacterium]|nr:hypothetical protein [Thermoanaerobaculia bacterium]